MSSFRKPNFFILGAPKCGTTSMHAYLSAHPEIFMPKDKEPHYFSTDLSERYFSDLKSYEALFADVPESVLAVGEASVRYFRSVDAVSNILAYQPDALFIVMLRNPVDMAPSVHQQQLFSLSESEPSFERAWRLMPERAAGRLIPSTCGDPTRLDYGNVCAHGRHLQRLYQNVPKNRVMLVFTEDMKNDPEGVFTQITRFLGVRDWRPESFDIHNVAKRRKIRALKWLTIRLAKLKQSAGFRQRFGLLNMVDRWNKSPAPRQPLSPEFRTELTEYFLEDVILLEQLTGRNLSHWRTV